MVTWPIIKKKIDRQSTVILGLSLAIFWGAAVYYIYALDYPGIGISLVLAAASFLTIRPRLLISQIPERRTALDRPNAYLILIYVLLWLALFAFLWAARSERPLISPWETVKPIFFWTYAASIAVLAIILLADKVGRRSKIWLLAAHYFLSAGAALIIYKIGYGFDPFVHEATMKLIVEKGAVLPKPPYYLGQYSLLVMLAKLTGASVAFLNRLAVPILSALLLPAAFHRFLRDSGEGGDDSASWLTILFFPIIGFSPFIATTPQNLSYLFLILTVLAGYRRSSLLPVWILALATTAIHPLTGLPALAWCAFLSWQNYRAKLSRRAMRISRSIIFAFAALGLPLALAISAGASLRFDAVYWQSLWSSLFAFTAAGRESWQLNFVYFFAGNHGLFLVALSVVSLLWAYRRRAEIAELLTIETALFISYLVSRGLAFDSLIEYEQSAYAGRIPVIMAIFALPFVILAAESLIKKIRREPVGRQIVWLIFGIGLATISLYISYPRFDRYWNSRGYSTSVFDARAVKSVETDAAVPYIALANQQVSAAALRELGFDHYYESSAGPLYIYPIPTGGPLYRYYLDMVYGEPSRERMAEAASLAGVKRGYLIVNKYWYQSGQVINAAKLAADRWWDIDGEVYVFLYQF